MDLLDLVYDLLRKTDKPMKPAEIAAGLLRDGFWKTQGKTPAATIGSRIYMDIKKNGAASRFVKIGSGQFALAEANRPQEAPLATMAFENQGNKRSPIKGTRTLSFADCAEKVLLEQCKHVPMHYLEVRDDLLDDSEENTVE